MIRPSRALVAVDFGELWEYRDLLFFLVWRDVKVRYRQSAFGVAWAILQPFLMMIVFSIFLGNLAKVPSNGLPYPIFSYSALVPWTLFSQSLIASSESLVGNSMLVSKVYFPRLFLPVGAVGAFLLDYVIAMTLVFGMMAYYGIAPTIWVLTVPFFAVLAVIVALAFGLWLSALNVRYRDIHYAVPFVVQLWLFLSPVAYSASLVPAKWRLLYALNPMAGVVEGSRWALIGSEAAPGPVLGVSVAATILLLLSGLVYFRRMERTFADVI